MGAMYRIFFLLSLLLSRALPAYAQVNPTLIPESGTIGDCDFATGDIHFGCIPLYVAYLIQVAFSLIGGVCLIEIIIAGYQITVSGFSGGDKSAGYGRLRWALIGLAIAVLSYLIVDTLVSALLSGV